MLSIGQGGYHKASMHVTGRHQATTSTRYDALNSIPLSKLTSLPRAVLTMEDLTVQ